MGADGSQQQALSGDREVTLLLKPVPEQALEQQQYLLGQHSEELMHSLRNSPLWSLKQTEKPPLEPGYLYL
ncbi:hypothetical protein UY3_15521 [Chelonia mydas]|uniref:Uncharacterized protein n=1 Tax=Chelonia mydas TaxID=8469 RepID=M7BGL6_CHEMY|nr:hypothetical protein UY3_15521 [Chelonia mydas]